MKHVTFHLPSFLRRVRIHGGEFDSSARAMNRVNGKGSLMSYERAVLVQAESRIVRGSTFERKQMSTSIKRIALVAVAALGLSLVSVVPSSAAINQDTLTLSAATAAQTTAETFTATSAVATLSFLGATGDSASVTAALVSGPAGNTALPYLRLTETASATINENTGGAPAAGSPTAPNTAVRVGAGDGTKVTTAKFAIYLSTNGTAAPTVAGAYVVRITPAALGASGALLGAKAVDLAITVTTAATQDKTVDIAKSTSILNTGETVSATADATVTGSMTVVAGTASTGTIAVTLNNAAGSPVVESYTAAILSGPGLLGSGVQSDATTHGAQATGRAITVKNGDSVGVFPDGSSGVSKIEIRTAAGVLIATETVTFFGAVASIVATVAKPVIGVRTEAAVVTAVAKDAAGTTVTAPKLYITSGTTTIISDSYVEATGVAGVTSFSLTGVKAGTASLVVSNGSTAALSTVSAAAVSVRVGGIKTDLDGLTIATDKTSYAPGEVVTLTITPTDAAGLVLADDTQTVFTTAGIAPSHSLTTANAAGTAAYPAGAVVHNGGVDGTGTKSGVATYKFYAPNIEGDVKLSWTRSSAFATAANDDLTGSLTFAVSSPGTAAATDAANEATDAANAATDAALAAAEAADAATSAAQEASDAVAALSESVTKLIAGLQSQIKSLAAVVAKIARKVKA
jgi:trimeric autotransporter adhesin